jgi:predicted dehydrogenase
MSRCCPCGNHAGCDAKDATVSRWLRTFGTVAAPSWTLDLDLTGGNDRHDREAWPVGPAGDRPAARDAKRRSPVRTLSIVQVGGGIWGRSWAELVHRANGFRLAALADASAAVREWASSELGVPTFPGLGQALDGVAADAVLLVSPPETHRPLGEEALARGLHVLSEKPLALTLADASALAGTAERTGLHVMVAQNYRFRRQARALAAIVATGTLGRLHGIRITCRRDLRNAWVSPRGWRAEMAHPYIFEMAIHHVDLLRMITGREVVQVDALVWKAPDSPFRMEPNLHALLTLADGTPVAYEGDFAASGAETSWNGEWQLGGDRARATWIGPVNQPLRGPVVVE